MKIWTTLIGLLTIILGGAVVIDYFAGRQLANESKEQQFIFLNAYNPRLLYVRQKSEIISSTSHRKLLRKSYHVLLFYSYARNLTLNNPENKFYTDPGIEKAIYVNQNAEMAVFKNSERYRHMLCINPKISKYFEFKYAN